MARQTREKREVGAVGSGTAIGHIVEAQDLNNHSTNLRGARTVVIHASDSINI